MKSVWVSAGVALALVVLVSCGDSTDNGGPAQGAERGACYGNHTCNDELSCISDLCVDASGIGGADNSGGAGGTSSAGRGGSSGSSGRSGNSGGVGGAVGGGGGGEAGLSGSAGDASSDGGAAGASSAEPTKAALHITWSLEGADSHNPLTCTAAGGSTISILTTPNAGSDVAEDLFDCSVGQGSVVLDFGAYSAVTSLLNQQMQTLGDSSQLKVNLTGSVCDQIVSGHCVHDFAVKVLIDGK